MKRYVMMALVAVLTTGCSSVVTKNFKVFTNPSDAVIRVVSGTDLKEQQYHSPAAVTVDVPKDPKLAEKAVLEVQRENYKPKVVALKDIREGETLNLRLEKIIQNLVRYGLKYRMTAPVTSSELRFRDRVIAIAFTIGDQSFNMRFDNVGDHDVKILWERAEYTDVNKQPHRIMPSTVRFSDRNNPLPDQIVPAKASVQEAVIPITNVFLFSQKKGYEIHPLFPLDSDIAAGLKGKSVNLFLPVEVDRAIIPYNFRIEIIDAVKETMKN
ncbi:MAG: hypothetical protein M0Z89_03150 [Nitrospiraceae bacterium]|nr:hypothetical protein [Nitrospiraceae bacterium]